jgi:pyruvate dehydrogenase E2 component (dihydrolipoamide acetyltransferase)
VPTEFTMPKLGLTMEEGTVLEWLVPDGAVVSDGTPVMLVETDKVETEVNVSGTGRLHHVGEVGQTYACGEVVGLLLREDEEAPAATAPSAPAAPGAAPPGAPSTTFAPPPAASAPVAASPPAAASSLTGTSASVSAGGRLLASPNARRVAAGAGIDIARVRGTGPGGRIVSEDVDEAIAAGSAATAPAGPAAAQADVPAAAAAAAGARVGAGVTEGVAGGVAASVAGRQLADLLGIDLATVAADPAEGRVTRDAVARHVRTLLGGAAPAAAPRAAEAGGAGPTSAIAPVTQTPTSVVPLRGMRGTIAKRMHASLQEMAQLTLFMDADLGAVVADRTARSERGTAPGFTDYVIAAAARALRTHPGANAQVVDGGIALLPDVHVGMAVAVEDGLMVPVIHHADRLDLSSLAVETKRLAEAARTKTVALEDLTGGTFSVSALGMFGVDGFTPVINPPNVAILGVGRLRDDVVLTDGHVGTVKRLTLSLTWDHRVLDGAPAAELCREIVRLLALPAELD